MSRYTITVHREKDDISPVAAVICGFCYSVVLVLGTVGAEQVDLPLTCEQPAINNYPCGAAMALINNKSVRETLDNLAASLQNTDDE